MVVIPQGGTVQLRDGEFVVSGADSALVLVAIATNFRRFDDVSGDPEAITRAQLNAATAKTFKALRARARCRSPEALPARGLRAAGNGRRRTAHRPAHPQLADQR